jgi:chromosome segregation ATPase
MNDELVKDKLETHERRLNKHGEILDRLEQDNASFKTELKNLCENLKQLTSVLKGLIGLGATALVGFFVYYLENFIK